MKITARHRHHVAQVRRHIGLVITVVSPGGHRPIAFECQTVKSAPSDRHHVAQVSRNIGLAIAVFSPSHHRPVYLKRQTVVSARCHRHHIGQGRHIGLTRGVVSPSQDLFGNGKYLIRSMHHPRDAVAHCQAIMVALIFDQVSNRVCNPNNK